MFEGCCVFQITVYGRESVFILRRFVVKEVFFLPCISAVLSPNVA